MSFGPISVLASRFNSSKYNRIPAGLKHSAALILNQNLIFELPSNT